jgi:membrane protein
MNSLKAQLEETRRSRVGLFVKKVTDDEVPSLASLLAWGTLSALLPLILGILGVAGLVLSDPQRLDEVYNTLLVMLPPEAAAPLREALQGVRESAAPAGILALVLLLFNGSSLFAHMASVFDRAYHVEGRNFVVQRVVAIGMVVVTTALLVVSTGAAGLGSLIGDAPIGPIGPLVARVVSWSISILSAFLFFLLIYKVLPNAKQGWRDVLPGTLLASVLFFIILMVFPLYVRVFPPNQAYALFGVFLVFTFWLYLLGIVFVLGAELNAFLQQPSRSPAAVALARSTAAQVGEQRAEPRPESRRPSLGGQLLGFIGLIFAAVLLRRMPPRDQHVSTPIAPTYGTLGASARR